MYSLEISSSTKKGISVLSPIVVWRPLIRPDALSSETYRNAIVLSIDFARKRKVRYMS